MTASHLITSSTPSATLTTLRRAIRWLGEWRDHQASWKPLLKAETQVRPGASGAPLLNIATGAICGLVKSSRGRAEAMGGRAIPVDAVVPDTQSCCPRPAYTSKLSTIYVQSVSWWKTAHR